MKVAVDFWFWRGGGSVVSSIEEATKAQTTLKLKAVCVLVELSQAARLRIRLTHSPHTASFKKYRP